MAYRWGMSWIVIVVVCSVPGSFFVSYIAAWQLGHIDPILPFISDTGERQPESCIFAQLLNIAAVFVAIMMYVRYRQVAVYLSSSQKTVHPERVNKASLAIGFLSVFGMTLVANFQWHKTMVALQVIHTIGAFMGFGLVIVYCWTNVALSLITLRQLSSMLVCWLRVVLSIIASALFLARFSDIELKANAACQWAMMTSLVLYFLTFINEFRYISVKPEVEVADRQSPPIPLDFVEQREYY